MPSLPTQFVKIGTILKPVGTSGELKVEISDEFIEDFVASPHIFVKINGAYVPYFIENIRENNYILFKMEEVDSPEAASRFTLKDIFLREKDLRETETIRESTKTGWIDFEIWNENVLAGVIEDIQIFPGQVMAMMRRKGQLVMIPLADALINEVSEAQKRIYMSLPEGIL
jgi:16S rRNA processing protein RimM